MIEVIKIVILSILFWQIITCIAIMINDDKGLYFSVCVPAFILNIIGWIYRKIKLKYAKIKLKYAQKHLCCVAVRSEKLTGPVPVFTFYCTHKQYERFYHKGENEHYIEFLKDGSTFKSAPFKDEIYREQERFAGYKEFKKEFVNPNK